METLHQRVLELLPAAEAMITGEQLHEVMDVLSEAKGAMNSRDTDDLRACCSRLEGAAQSLSAAEGN